MSATASIGTLEGLLRWRVDGTELDKALDNVAKKAGVSRTQLNAYNREIDAVNKNYMRVAASINPAIAAEQKYEKAHSALSAALKIGLIDHEKYNSLLDQAKKKYSETESPLKSLIESVVKLTGSLGPVGAGAHEAAEGVAAMGGKVSSLTGLLGELGPLLPVVLALGAALTAVGIAFAAFEFVKGAVEEGLKLQGVIERLNESLRNTGSYSGLSAAQIVELADKYEFLTGRTKEEEIEAALVLSRFKSLNGEAYPKALDLTNALAHSLGISLIDAAKRIGPILDGNTRSLRSLREEGITLLPSQQKMLTQMVEAGNIAGYQAKLFDILTEKVGKAADIHETLGIQAGRAKDTFDELKEGIASELIPALEDLAKDVINQLGGWDNIKEKASAFGHYIGEGLRTFVYGTILVFHDLAASWDELAILIDKAIITILTNLGKFLQWASKAPIVGGLFKSMADGIGSALKTSFDTLTADTIALGKNQKASNDAILNWVAHKQALEGDTNVIKGHKSAVDEVGKAQQKVNDIMAEAVKIVQEYTDKLSDQADKLIATNVGLLALNKAAKEGLDVYARELLVQERENAVLAARTQLDKDHRTEIEKLIALKEKAKDQPGESAHIQSQIDDENKAYDRQRKAIGDLAGANIDLKHSTDLVIDSAKDGLDYTGRQTEAWAQLIDALTGTNVASRENSIQVEISKRVLDSLKHTQDDLTDSITESVRREHDFIDSMKDALDVAKELGSLNNQANLATAIAKVDTGQSKYLQQIETQFLQTVANIGHGSIEEGQRMIDSTQKALDAFGLHIGDLSELIKKDLEKIQDAEISKTISGASKTPYDLYKEERDRIEQYVNGSTTRTSQQVKDAYAYLDKLDKDYWSSEIDTWTSALSTIGQAFGGFIGRLLQQAAQIASTAKSVYQAGSQIGSALGQLNGQSAAGAAAFGGAAGGILAEAYIFYAVGSIVNDMIKKDKAKIMSTLTQLQMVGGEWSSPSYFNETGRQANVAIRNLINSILDSINGVLTDLPQITIRARADGKKFGAYVAGIFVGEYDTAQEAMQAAVAQAISQASFTGLAEEMQKALNASLGKTLDELQANVATANDAIRDRIGDVGATFVENIDKYIRRIEKEHELGLATDATTQAMIRSIESYKNQILGIDTTASDRLAGLRSLDAGLKEASDSLSASLQKQIDDVMKQISQLENPGPSGGGKGGTGTSGTGGTLGNDGLPVKGGGPLPVAPEDAALAHLREVLAQYTAELNKIPKALTDQEINMGIFDTLYQYLQSSPKYAKEAAQWAKVKVDIEFAQIKLQLELLNKWEEFQGMFNDAYNAALAAAGKPTHAGGGKSNDKQSVQSFIDDRKFQLQLAQMDQFHQQLAQITHDYAAQLLAAGKDKKLREELLALQQQETQAAIQAHQKDIADRFAALLAPSDAFTSALKPFEDMKKEIEGAGFGADRTARMIARLTTAEDEAVKKLSMQQFSSLVGDLSNVIADSKTNAEQHALHNDLLRAQEIINFQIKMIELKDEYVILKAKGKLTQDELTILDKAFNWIDANANILPGGKDWIPDFEQSTENVASAANSLDNASNDLQSAAQALIDYQTSLHTDSSLGLVNSREALDNSKAIYEGIAAKALTGDVDAIKQFKDAAETYRKNEIAFSPSSGLAASVLQGIDATINRIKALPSVAAALTPDGSAIVKNLSYVIGGVSSIDINAQAINDNLKTTPPAIASAMNNTMETQTDKITAVQEKTNQTLIEVGAQIKTLANNVIAFRTEARTNSDDVYTELKRAADALDTVAKNTAPRHKKAGVGG